MGSLMEAIALMVVLYAAGIYISKNAPQLPAAALAFNAGSALVVGILWWLSR